MSAVSDSLLSFLNTVSDSSLLIVSSSDGEEIATANKEAGGGEDLEMLKAFIPRLIVSADQAKRLSLGNTQYSITWAGRRILLHMKIFNNISVSMLMEDTANLGLIDEYVEGLRTLLKSIGLEE